MQDDLAVDGGLENRAFALEFVAEHGGVDQVAVVSDRDLAAEAIDHKRLRILQRARTGRRIARMTDGARPLQAFQISGAENLRDQTHVAMHLKGAARAVRGHDAGALLAAMLEREQTVVGQDRRVRMSEDGENAALVLRKHC